MCRVLVDIHLGLDFLWHLRRVCIARLGQETDFDGFTIIPGGVLVSVVVHGVAGLIRYVDGKTDMSSDYLLAALELIELVHVGRCQACHVHAANFVILIGRYARVVGVLDSPVYDHLSVPVVLYWPLFTSLGEIVSPRPTSCLCGHGQMSLPSAVTWKHRWMEFV